jgi:hypothetical protein
MYRPATSINERKAEEKYTGRLRMILKSEFFVKNKITAF